MNLDVDMIAWAAIVVGSVASMLLIKILLLFPKQATKKEWVFAIFATLASALLVVLMLIRTVSE
jgi:hypothetical protein